MKQQLLLLEDVDSLGKKGEIVVARPGYVRNFLLPKGYAVVANANMLRKQERLRSEREKQGLIDRQIAETTAQKIEGITIETAVKVDPEGHMYGSVTPADIIQLFHNLGFDIEKKNLLLTRPIKEVGTHPLSLKLKEGVMANCVLKILPEGSSLSSEPEDVVSLTSPEVVPEQESTE